jgi:hypothetical protein
MPRLPECYIDVPYVSADRHFTTTADDEQLISLRSIQRFARLGTPEPFSYPGLASGTALINAFTTESAAFEALHGVRQLVSAITKVDLVTGDKEGVVFDEMGDPFDTLRVGSGVQATWKASGGVYSHHPVKLDGTVSGQFNLNLPPVELVSYIRSRTTPQKFRDGAEIVTRQFANQRINVLLSEFEQAMPDSPLYKFTRMLRRAGHAVVFMGVHGA